MPFRHDRVARHGGVDAVENVMWLLYMYEAGAGLVEGGVGNKIWRLNVY